MHMIGNFVENPNLDKIVDYIFIPISACKSSIYICLRVPVLRALSFVFCLFYAEWLLLECRHYILQHYSNVNII